MSFLLQATIFLGASLILVPLGKRLGIATVLGYLFTGILLGPSVLNIAHDPEAIMELAEFGGHFTYVPDWSRAPPTTFVGNA